MTKRSFWLHQLCEYVVAGFLVSAAIQSNQPLAVSLLAVAVLLNATTVQGPLSAFQLVPRNAHRILDLVLIVVMTTVALLADLNPSARVTVLGLTALMAMIALGTNYAKSEPRVRSSTPSDRSEQFAKTAGRTAGRIGRAIKDRNQ